MRHNPSIIFIGPAKTGKSTTAKLVAAALGWRWIELDDARWAYYAEVGYDHDYAQQLRREGGMKAVAAYWKPFDIHAVERVLADYPTDHVISFGAGHSVYEDPAQLERAQRALAGFPNVVLLLPSPDVEESVRMMKERLHADEPEFTEEALEHIAQINRHFVEHPSNARLATLTIYTKDKSPQQTRDEILRTLELRHTDGADDHQAQ